nr:uncharacterized protein LOC111847029 [Paramormyrops kingsleyae]
MVMSGVWTVGLLTLFLIFKEGESNLNNQNLHNIIKGMKNRLDPQKLRDEIRNKNNPNMATGVQYSVGLQLTSDDCDSGSMTSVTANFAAVRNQMANEAVFNTAGVTAAIPWKVYNNNGQLRYTDHAEYRVLKGLGRNQAKCLIVYTYFSPCLTKCLDEDNRNNIIWMLGDVFKQQVGYKAFVYDRIFYKDTDVDQLYNVLKQINSVPVYCCDNNRCTQFDGNRGLDQTCLNV